MNVFDFDNTIYDGESTFDFYLYCVKHHPETVKFMFVVVWSFIKYKMCLVSEQQLRELADKYVADFLRCCPDAKELAEKFWDENIKKIKPCFRELITEDDIIVSASFGFLLRPVLEKLGIKKALMSEVDLDSAKVLRLCYRKNKVALFRENFKNVKVRDVYTDSLNDKPLMSLADKNVFIVKGNGFTKYSGKKC